MQNFQIVPEPPKTYDDIARRTVPDPDGGWRPTPEQLERTREGIREQSASETELLGRVRDALTAAHIDVSKVQLDIDREQVTVRGEVKRLTDMVEIENAIAAVHGVETVVDLLVIA